MKKEENFSRSVMVCLMLIVVLIFAIVCTGCGTAYGIVSDTEAGAGWLRKKLAPVIERRDQRRIELAQDEQKERVRKAADLVIKERSKNNQ